MKTILLYCGAAILLIAALQSKADILAGPITNVVNGHEYYLLTPNTWNGAEAEAERLGGTLAVINDPAEDRWIFATFSSYGSVTNRTLWIGLRREEPDGAFIWVNGTNPSYTNWGPGEPDNCGGNESYVHIWSNSATFPGKWNDAGDDLNLDGSRPCGVVEMLGKSDRLTPAEKSLLGTWYEGGRRDRLCYIATTGNQLFQIYSQAATRMYRNGDSIYLLNGIRGEIMEDKILWNNGTWWSRSASKHPLREKAPYIRTPPRY